MGIKNLTTFVDGKCRYMQLQFNHQGPGKLVVDGNCILHSLHTMEWSNGGQYREFRNAVCRFYSKLLESGITPIVVFDGVDETQKIDTLLGRNKERVDIINDNITDNSSREAACVGRILPPLFSEVYRMVLYRLDIKFHVADGEADVVIATLANKYGCPVLSEESDFFVFRLIGGFIQFKHFYWESHPITADVYHRDQFANQLQLRDTSLVCLIPALVGNDFLEPCRPNNQMPNSESPTIQDICSYLLQFPSVKAFLDKSVNDEAIQLQCQKALEWYEVQNEHSCEKLVSSTNLNGSKFPQWLVELFRHGHLPSFPLNAALSSQVIFHVVADNFNKESSVLAAKPIRLYIYALLEVKEVDEFIRCGLDIKRVKATRRDTNGEFSVTIASVESLSHQKRQSLFYEILQCNDLDIKQKLSVDWRFVAATVSFWARSTHPPEHLVRALLRCFMLCLLPDENSFCGRCKVPSAFRQSQEWLDTLHWFSQWQAIYHAAWTLNALLMEPMWVFSPAFLYDGELAMYLASSGNTSQLMGEINTTLYNRLEEIVFSARLPYGTSEHNLSSAYTASLGEAVHPAPQLATSVNSVDEQQGPSNAQITHSPQVTSAKGQNLKTHQTQKTTFDHSIDKHQVAVGTQSTPSPAVECGKGKVKPTEDKEQIREQQKCSGHVNSAWGSEAVATTVGQSAVQNGTTPPETKRKRPRQKEAQTKVEVVSGNGGNTNTLHKYPMDNTSAGIPSADSKPPAYLKSPTATPTASTNDTAYSNVTTSEAKHKREHSRHKRAQPAQRSRKEIPLHSKNPENSQLPFKGATIEMPLIQRAAGAISVTDKPVQVRTQTEQGKLSPTSPSTTLSTPQNGKDRAMLQTKQLEMAARPLNPAVQGHNEGKLKKNTLLLQDSTATASSKRRRRRLCGKTPVVPQREAQNPGGTHCRRNAAASPSSSAQMTEPQQSPATTTKPAPQRNGNNCLDEIVLGAEQISQFSTASLARDKPVSSNQTIGKGVQQIQKTVLDQRSAGAQATLSSQAESVTAPDLNKITEIRQPKLESVDSTTPPEVHDGVYFQGNNTTKAKTTVRPNTSKASETMSNENPSKPQLVLTNPSLQDISVNAADSAIMQTKISPMATASTNGTHVAQTIHTQTQQASTPSPPRGTSFEISSQNAVDNGVMQPETAAQGSSLQTSAMGQRAEKTTLLQLEKPSANQRRGAATATQKKRNRAPVAPKTEDPVGADQVVSSSSSAPMTRGKTIPPQTTTIPSLQKRGQRSKKGHGGKTGKTNASQQQSCCQLLTESSAIFGAKSSQASTPSKENFQQSPLTGHRLAQTYCQCAVAVLVVGFLCFSFALIWLMSTNST